MSDRNISKQTIRRIPIYLQHLKDLKIKNMTIISAPSVAAELKLNEVQVRKDFAAMSTTHGKPKTGFIINELIINMESFAGYNNTNEAILVGAGSLGKALLSYKGFEIYGLDIVAAFDIDSRLTGTEISGKVIFPLTEINEISNKYNIKIGIITVPANEAQKVCDVLVCSGIMAIWNFAPVHLTVPADILVQNENMAASLAMLSKHLREHIEGK
ncbi:MAG: redox-sensing transcriptional repressor Rex [Clostridiales bacterium GWF2_38_85]|nr:MAG: redox-sensing transcriptional repressor Rex [Clostridiales bacterium GWF2_38_85]HBL85262.1 redox-sensing transcriptional repressor Rex [Clostridiales bacterium]